jgi:hypothetical protein
VEPWLARIAMAARSRRVRPAAVHPHQPLAAHREEDAMSDRFAKYMFLVAAIWNFYAAFVGLFFTKYQFEFFFDEELWTGDYNQVFLFRAFWVAVLLFGIAYLLVSLNTSENRGIVWLGILGKLAVFAFFTHAFFSDEATAGALAIVIGDLVWSAIFAWFLYSTRERVRVNNLLG